jgi:hypothetical protein
METFTATDIDGGYGAATTLLYIGEPPFAAENPDNPVDAVLLIKQGIPVWFNDSETVYETLLLLGLTDDEAAERLRIARFGPLGAV